jgi:hypothetical protein
LQPANTIARAVLWLSAAPFVGIGLAFLIAPATMSGYVGVTLAGATADGDVRAVYGGLQLGCGAFLASCAAKRGWLSAGIAAQLLLFSGLFGARLVCWIVAGPPDPLGFALHGAELLGILAGAIAWRASHRSAA